MFKFEIEDPHFLPHLSCKIHLDLLPGEGTIISGPNGMGKSTFLHRLIQQYRSLYHFSLVGQKPLDYFYDRTVREVRNILLQSRKEQVVEKKLLQLWEGLGLVEKEDRPLSALSGGELQSLKLALGLGKKASVFLLDEPFQSLDVARKAFLCGALDDWRREGSALLVVEHDLNLFSGGWNVLPLLIEQNTLMTGEKWSI